MAMTKDIVFVMQNLEEDQKGCQQYLMFYAEKEFELAVMNVVASIKLKCCIVRGI